MRRITLKVGELYGFTIWRYNGYPGFCYDTTKASVEAKRKSIFNLVGLMEEKALTMEQAKSLITGLKEKYKA